MNQNLEKHTCGECNFSTSRKFNLIRHHERHHKRQSSFNSYVQKTALEQSPFQGGQAFTQEQYQQPVQVQQTGGQAPGQVHPIKEQQHGWKGPGYAQVQQLYKQPIQEHQRMEERQINSQTK